MALSFIVLWNASLKVAGLNPIRLMWKLSDLTGCYPELEVLCVQQQDWDHTAPLHPLQHQGLVHFSERDLSTSPTGTQQEGLVHITDRDSAGGTCPPQREGLVHITNRDLSNSPTGTCPHRRQGSIFEGVALITRPTLQVPWVLDLVITRSVMIAGVVCSPAK